MAKTQPSSAVAGLQDQIETIRREAFDAGYLAAMRAVSEFTAGPAKSKTTTAKAASLRAAEPRAATRPARSQAKPGARKAVRPTGAARRKTSRGDNARHVAEAMNGFPDRTGPAAAIRKALAGKVSICPTRALGTRSASYRHVAKHRSPTTARPGLMPRRLANRTCASFPMMGERRSGQDAGPWRREPLLASCRGGSSANVALVIVEPPDRPLHGKALHQHRRDDDGIAHDDHPPTIRVGRQAQRQCN